MYSKGQDEMDGIYQAVLRRFQNRIARQEVSVIRTTSSLAAIELPPLDWVYIDGDHTYEGVTADLGAFWPLIRAGGCLAGDDYEVEGWWKDGVTRAVDEFCLEQEFERTIIGSQFLIRKPVLTEIP
jgi:hypothetical protein